MLRNAAKYYIGIYVLILYLGSPLQMFDDFYCKCRCKDASGPINCLRASGRDRRKFWDEETCKCICKPEEFRRCSTGFVYDAIDTCG